MDEVKIKRGMTFLHELHRYDSIDINNFLMGKYQ